MGENHLTLEQNTCAARIFLNTFGLTLGNVKDIDEFSKIKIFDRTMKEVGELHFDNGKVIITANYNNSILEANFDIAKVLGFVDSECKNAPFALFGQWFSKIEFQVKNPNNINISGEFLLDCSVDTEFGVSCRCHPLINCDVAGKGNKTLKILRNGRTFGLEVSSGSYKETIDIMPWDDINGFIKHVISCGKNRQEHRRYGVFSAGIGNEDKLHLFLSETKYGTQISFRNEFPPKFGDDESELLVIQKGILMQELDPDMFGKIQRLGAVLCFGDISLLDNLVSVCYDSYTDAELSALLGIERQHMIYQDGADNLINSYFGIGKESKFLSIEQQKRLLKK